MGFNMLYIFAALLLVTVGADRYDQGPQKFYDISSDSITSEQNENKEVLLYLTPEQVKSLEANGAVVQSNDDSESEEADAELSEPQINEGQSEEAEQDEDEAAQQEEEAQEEEQESLETNQDIDFEEILRILNEQQVEEQGAEEAAKEQVLNEPQVEEENTESPRNFSPRIILPQPQQQQQQQLEQKYVAPAVKREQILKSYSYIRYQPNEQPQRINVQLFQPRQQANNVEESNEAEEPQTETLNQEKKKYKLIPYQVEETSAESSKEENSEEQAQLADNVQRINGSPLLDADRLTEAIGQRKIRLLKNELRLQTILGELKISPKHNEQKYAIEIENLRANFQKQNALSKAEAIAKVAPALVMQQINKKRLNKFTKQGKASGRDAESQQGKPQQSNIRKSTAPAENQRSIRVPEIKAEKTEFPRSIPIPVENGRRLSVKNVYAKTRTDRPFIVSRRVPEDRRQSLVEVPKSKPERITILRHVWEH